MLVVDIEQIKREAFEEAYHTWKTDFFKNRLKLIAEPAIRQAVCEEYGVTWPEIYGHSKKDVILLARQVYCFLMRKLTKYTYPEIGKLVGYTDHTGPMYCMEVIGKYFDTDEQVKTRIINLVIKLNDDTPSSNSLM